MKGYPDNPARTALGLAGLWVLLHAGVGAVEELPDGVKVGRWIVAPVLRFDIDLENNLFRSPTAPEDDRVGALRGEVTGSLPFRNSLLELDYAASNFNFENNDFPSTVAQTAGARLDLQFSSGDMLRLGERYTRDFANLREVDAGGELQFEGEPYHLNEWEVMLERALSRRQGYVMHVRRKDFNYTGDSPVSFFDYRGFDNDFEFRQPLSEERWWVVHYRTRRFNHYDANDQGRVGIPFRKEEADSVQTGISGNLGPDRPYLLRLGIESFRYLGAANAQFRGIVGAAQWRIPLGGRAGVNLSAERVPLPSNFNTYYISEVASAEFDREWSEFAKLTVGLVVARNRYGDLVDFAGCEQERRSDFTYDVQAETTLRVNERTGFRLQAYYTDRRSTCPQFGYDAAKLSGGVVIGWF